MNIPRDMQAEVLRLVGKLLDEQLGDGDKARLSELLRDPATAKYYLSLMAIHTELEWQHADVPQATIPAVASHQLPALSAHCDREINRRPAPSDRRKVAAVPFLKFLSSGLQPSSALLLLAFLGISTITIWAISHYQVPTEQAVQSAPPKPVA